MLSGMLAMNSWKSFLQIFIEETIRLMALEVVIGLLPVGIAEAFGADMQIIYQIARISLPIPLVIWVVMIVIRTRKKEKPTQVRPSWQMTRKGWIALGVGLILQALLVLFYSLKGLMTVQLAGTAIFTALLAIGIGVWLALRRNRK